MVVDGVHLPVPRHRHHKHQHHRQQLQRKTIPGLHQAVVAAAMPGVEMPAAGSKVRRAPIKLQCPTAGLHLQRRQPVGDNRGKVRNPAETQQLLSHRPLQNQRRLQPAAGELKVVQAAAGVRFQNLPMTVGEHRQAGQPAAAGVSPAAAMPGAATNPELQNRLQRLLQHRHQQQRPWLQK